MIDETLTTCYNTSCPVRTYKSTQVLGLTEIYVCKACTSTCYECSVTASNCTSCFASQNRELSSNACVPMSGFYEASVDIAAPCDSNCLTCTGSATYCTSCVTNMHLGGGNVCVLCSTTYQVGCLQCHATQCTLCDTGYVLAANGLSCIACSLYNSHCIFCDSMGCLTCSTGYFLTLTQNCQSCTTYDPLCTDCNQITCLTCSSGFILQNSTCQRSVNVVCGDGLWINGKESCDDGNLNDFDGCDSQCHI